MKKILLIICTALTIIACKNEAKSEKYTQEEYKTIETAVSNIFKNSDTELLDVKILQSDPVTTSNFDTNVVNLLFPTPPF